MSELKEGDIEILSEDEQENITEGVMDISELKEEDIEILSEDEQENVTGGGIKITTKNYTVNLRNGGSKVIWGLTSYFMQLQLKSGSNLISAVYWGGRAGIKITRKSSKTGVAKVTYQEQTLGGKYRQGTITVYCK